MDLLPMFHNHTEGCSLCADKAISVVVDPTRVMMGRTSFFVCESHLVSLLHDFPSHRERMLKSVTEEHRQNLEAKLENLDRRRAA